MFQEDAEHWEYERQMNAARDDRRKNGTGMVCMKVPGEWVESTPEQEAEARERTARMRAAGW